MNEKRTIILLLLALLLFITGTFDHSLWTPDEPRVAEIARTMAVTGDYLIPKLSNNPFLEQPPLYYAATGIFWRIFGTGNEGFGRLASFLFASCSVLVIFFGTRALYSERVATISALILATTWEFFLISHKMVVDNALAFFITGALISFILAYKQRLKRGYILFWVFLALAFMTKGIIGIAIPGVAVAIFILWQRDFSIILKAWGLRGILLVILVMSAWAWALYLRGGKEFLSTFFLYNNLGRFAGAGIYQGGHVNPFYYYIPTILLDGLPWSFMLIPALIAARKIDDRLRFFCSWFFGGLILLSLASTKRGIYFLPMYPVMAVMVGHWMSGMVAEGSARWEKRVLLAPLIILVLGTVLIPIGYVLKLGGSLPVALAVFLFSLLLLWLTYRKMAGSMPDWLPLGFVILLLTWAPLLFPQVDTLKTYKPFFQGAGTIVGKDIVISYRPTETVEAFCPFYGGFSVRSIEDRNQFEQMILSRAAQYAIILPGSGDAKMKILLEYRGQKVLEVGGKWRRKTQLWRLSDHIGGDTEEGK
jgi:Dolichyl-phosphate-mannose-protein mannosyltransferase